jgi:A/G-specific adenine glycosylase
MDISKEITAWYKQNKRELPWRRTKDPYKIWISEIILQQTRVDQGLNYYLRFIERFPNVETLAKAEEDDVLKYWQGLGYYSRARNLHYSAKYIMKELNGKFPKTFTELKKMKGVGDYTAGAIASFAYNEQVPLVDGNVYRFLSRLYAEDTPIDTTRGKKIFLELAKELLARQEAQIFNQAIMEFGALQCKPANPACIECPIQSKCLAFAKNEVDSFPVKSKKNKGSKTVF